MVNEKYKTGRPLTFNPQSILEATMNLFWDRGYYNVGLSDLEAHTGLNRSSLYNTFGSKEALFNTALNYYTEHLAGNMFAQLESGSRGITDIENFFAQLSIHLKTQIGRGCFMVNTMAEAPDLVSDDYDLAEKYITCFLRAVRAPLNRALTFKEISAFAAENGAEMLLGVALSANLLARAKQSPQLIDATLDSAICFLKRTR